MNDNNIKNFPMDDKCDKEKIDQSFNQLCKRKIIFHLDIQNIDNMLIIK